MSIFSPFTTTAANQAAGAINTGVQQGQAQALPWYLQGAGAIQGYGQQALNPLQTNYSSFFPGTTMYGNALGLGGAAGNKAAISAFQNNPSYQFQLQQLNNQQLAGDAATGQTGSGNEGIALQKLGQNYANTSWNNYLQNLQPYLGATQQAGGQIANTNLALGSGLNAAYGTVGNMYYGGALTGAQATAAAYMAQNQAGANQVNALGALGGGLLGYLSDARVKEDIEPVGALASGETIYRYRYAGDPRHQIGLIAQEVEDATPDAVFDAIGDLKGVDYRRATERAAKILEFNRVPYDSPPTHRPFAAELLEYAA